MTQDNEPKIILTRPEPGLSKFSGQLLHDLPTADVYNEPLQVIEFVPNILDLDGYNGFVFTSSNGVRAAKRWNLPKRIGFGVGSVTTNLASTFCDPVYNGGSNVDALIELILAQRPHGPLLHVRGKVSVGNLADRLSEHGIETHEVIGYEQSAIPASDTLLQMLQGGMPVILPLFSPKSAEILKMLSTRRDHWHVVAMSQAVAEIFCPDEVMILETAKNPNGAAMLEAVIDAWHGYRC